MNDLQLLKSRYQTRDELHIYRLKWTAHRQKKRAKKKYQSQLSIFIFFETFAIIAGITRQTVEVDKKSVDVSPKLLERLYPCRAPTSFHLTDNEASPPTVKKVFLESGIENVSITSVTAQTQTKQAAQQTKYFRTFKDKVVELKDNFYFSFFFLCSCRHLCCKFNRSIIIFFSIYFRETQFTSSVDCLSSNSELAASCGLV